MKKVQYFKTNSSDGKRAYVAVQSDDTDAALNIVLNHLMQTDQANLKPEHISRKPARAEFIADISNGSIMWADEPAPVKTKAGRPKGSCLPKELKRKTFTLSLLPDCLANIKKLPKGSVSRKLESMYCDGGSEVSE